MSTIRVNKTKGFTVMSNQHLRDKNLSLKAKGLMSVMLSLPDDWNYSIGGLVSISLESETAIKSTLNELKRNGYLVVTKLPPSKTESGRFEYIYDVYEHPIIQPVENQPLEKQGVEKQGVEILPLENLAVENPPVYKSTNQLNTDVLNTDKRNTDNKRADALSAAHAAPHYDYEPFKTIFNATCTKLPKCRSLTEQRKKAIRAYLKEYTVDQWQDICTNANASDFLTGKNDRGWKADIDFLLRIDKATKALEGGYANKDYREKYKEDVPEQSSTEEYGFEFGY